MANSSPMEGAQELQQMLVAYAKQETVEPIKALGSYLKYGIPGAICSFLGSGFLGLGVLRLLQRSDQLDGGGFASLVPYVGAMFTLMLMMGIIVLLMTRARKRVQP